MSSNHVKRVGRSAAVGTMLQHAQQQSRHLGGDAQPLDHERPVRSLHLVPVDPPTLQRPDTHGAPLP